MRINHPCTLHIVGKKNSGKSRLIEFLIRELKSEGLQIGAIKHSSHLHALDKKASDSDRFRIAGAVPTAFSTPGGFAIFYDEIPTENQIDLWNCHFEKCDIILIESFRQVEGPKLWICADQDWKKIPDHVIAIIDETRIHPKIPTFTCDDKNMCHFLLSYFQLKKIKEN
jgi:molybdopterin-guanine dinucleotide biosynthesis protein MobB